MLNTLRAKLLAGLVFAGGAYYVTPGALLARIGVNKAFEVDDFTVTDLKGNDVSLSDCRGRPVMVYIWTTYCPAAFESLPMMGSLYQKYRDTQLCFLPIAKDPDRQQWDDARQTIKVFSDQNQIPYPVYKGSGCLPAALDPDSTPYIYLIDRKGILRQSYVMLSDNRPKLEQDLLAMLYDGSPESKISMTDPTSQEVRSEYEEEDKLVAAVKYMFAREEYDQLDAMADDLRATKARFKRGKWKLPLFYEALLDLQEGDTWERQLEFFKKWSAARPGSVSARAAVGRLLARAAWKARGNGYSSDISEENSKLFKERLAEARTVLEEAEKLPAKCPGLYTALLKVAHGQGWDREEYENLFMKAVALEPEYPDLYVEKAYYLLPQWYGSPGEWEKFVEESAEAVKDSAGMELYPRIIWDMVPLYGKSGVDLFSKTAVSWPKMRQGYMDIDRKYPDSLILLNSFAWYACIAGDRETAKGVFARIGDRYNPLVWRDPIRYYKWRQWANEKKEANILSKFAKLFKPK